MLPSSFPYCLAPMDNLTHPVFRGLVAALLPKGTRMAFFSPAINPNEVLHKNGCLLETVPVNPGEILYYNLMHGDAETIVRGMENLVANGPAGFCLNCGCPRQKVQRTDKPPVGVALMGCPERVVAIIQAAKKAFPNTHFSVKMRAGLTHEPVKLYDFCHQIEDAGADAIIFHARSAEDQYARPARHELFGELKKRVQAPLIGNGDVMTDAQAVEVKAAYGLDGIMIGRGALLTPAIFRAIALKLAGQPMNHPVMSWEEKRNFLLAYAREADTAYGCVIMRKRVRLFARWFSNGVAFGQTLYSGLHKAKTLPEAEAAIHSFFAVEKPQYATTTF
ncbi:MAG: tRNA-dihydrouridine synthase family protein [Fibrobacterota bacterium]